MLLDVVIVGLGLALVLRSVFVTLGENRGKILVWKPIGRRQTSGSPAARRLASHVGWRMFGSLLIVVGGVDAEHKVGIWAYVVVLTLAILTGVAPLFVHNWRVRRLG